VLALAIGVAAACTSRAPETEPAALTTARAIAQGTGDASLSSLLVPDDGSWQLLDDQLTSPGWRAASTHRFDALGARLPDTADGVIDVGVSRVERLHLRLTMEGASHAAAEVDRGRVVYRGAWSSSDAILLASDTKLEELVLLHDSAASAEVAWQVTLPSGLVGARDDGRGGLLWLDASGQAALHTPRPYVLDAAGRRVDGAVRYAGGRLVVTYDAAHLTFPALLDPAIESAFWRRR
jgi:hypothetical protein